MSSSKDFQWIGESLEKLVEKKREQYQRNGLVRVPSSEKHNQLDSIQIYQEFDVIGSDEDMSNCSRKLKLGSNGDTFESVKSGSPTDGLKCQQASDESNTNSPQENFAFESTMMSNGFGIRDVNFMESAIEDEENPNFLFDTTADQESYKQSLEICCSSGPELLHVDDNNNINDAFLRSPQPQTYD